MSESEKASREEVAVGSDSNDGLGVSFTSSKWIQKHNITFHSPGGEKVGEFNFGQVPVTFEGDVDESARVFVEAVRRMWGNDLLSIQRERYARMVDHILREGGGTYGDLIRRA